MFNQTIFLKISLLVFNFTMKCNRYLRMENLSANRRFLFLSTVKEIFVYIRHFKSIQMFMKQTFKISKSVFRNIYNNVMQNMHNIFGIQSKNDNISRVLYLFLKNPRAEFI